MSTKHLFFKVTIVTFLNCETVFAVYKVHKWPKTPDTTNSCKLEWVKLILPQEKHKHL